MRPRALLLDLLKGTRRQFCLFQEVSVRKKLLQWNEVLQRSCRECAGRTFVAGNRPLFTVTDEVVSPHKQKEAFDVKKSFGS